MVTRVVCGVGLTDTGWKIPGDLGMECGEDKDFSNVGRIRTSIFSRDTNHIVGLADKE